METNTTLLNQDGGKELEYQIIAVNKAGESPPSIAVMAILQTKQAGLYNDVRAPTVRINEIGRTAL